MLDWLTSKYHLADDASPAPGAGLDASYTYSYDANGNLTGRLG